MLMKHVREIQETKKLLVAVQEKKWRQFWKS
ncbi:DUF3967 domain-containing protein [Bacillus sp. JJ864]